MQETGDVHSIESVVFDKLNGRFDESGTLSGIRDEVEVAILAVRPTADGEDNLEVPEVPSMSVR
jgi:hypothetical protein